MIHKYIRSTKFKFKERKRKVPPISAESECLNTRSHSAIFSDCIPHVVGTTCGMQSEKLKQKKLKKKQDTSCKCLIKIRNSDTNAT